MNKRLTQSILVIIGTIILSAGIARAASTPILVPSSAGRSFMLVSTSTGAYIATTTDPIHGGYFYATSTTASRLPTISVDTFSNLTSNGFVKTGSGNGTLSIDTSTYLTGNQTITLSGDISGSGATSMTTAIGNGKVTNAMLAGSITASNLVGSDIATLGTITSGIWNAGALTSSGALTINGTGISTIAGSLGIGTTSPYTTLAVVGTTTAAAFVATSTTATSTFRGTVFVATSSPTIVAAINNGPFTPFGNFVSSCENCGNAGGNLIAIGAYGSAPTVGINTFSARGSTALPSATQAGDSLYFMGGRGFGNTVWANGSKAAIIFTAAAVWTDASQGTYMTFNTTPINSTTRAEIMRIDSTGLIGIGTTSPYTTLSVVGTTTALAFTATSTTATSTFNGGVYVSQTSSSTAPYIYSKTSGFGGHIIIEDEGGGACTEITTKVGVVKAAVITCPPEL